MVRFRNIAKRSLLTPLLLALVASPIIAVLQTNPAFANDYDKMTALGRIKLQDGLEMLEICENAAGRLIITAGHGDFVDDTWSIASEYDITNPDLGSVPTGDANKIRFTLPAYYEDTTSITCGEVFPKYASLFGITDAEAFLNDAGYRAWSDNYRAFSGSCNNSPITNSTELYCLKSAITKRVGNYQSTWDTQMYYVRNKTILDADIADGGCSAHWTSNTTPGKLDIDEWLSSRGRSGYDGILGTRTNPTVINLVNNSNDPASLTPFWVMSEGGDGSGGWQKSVNLGIFTGVENIMTTSVPTGGEEATCENLANALNDRFSQGYVNWALDWHNKHPGESLPGSGVVSSAEGSPSNSGTSCAIPGIGWILCPVMTFMAEVNDSLYKIVASQLETNVKIVSTDPDSAYGSWQIMRNFANAGFVVFFLIIIFSQVTGLGISNYGLKKLLPRLIIAAILVNLSYFICQLAVDLSNILGGSVNQLLSDIPIFDSASRLSNVATVTSDILSGALATGTVVVAIGSVLGEAGLLLPVLLAAFLAILVTLLILVVRQVLVILLVVASPLAFLAMLLPNTEKLFKQWRKLLVSMLVLYPIIAVLFGASTLAASIIVANGDTSTFQKIVGVLIMFVPLGFTPMILKDSLKAVPYVGSLANKLASKANSNVGKKVKPFVDLQKSRREAGLDRWGRERKPAKFLKGLRNRQNYMAGQDGKPLLDRQGNKIPAEATRKRTLTQVSGDSLKNVEKEIAINKTKEETGWANRGLNAEGRIGRRTRSRLDEEQNEALKKEAVGKTYEARLADRKVNDPGIRDVNDQLHDAKQHIDTSESKQKKRQIERVRDEEASVVARQISTAGPQNLRDIQREQYTAEAGVKSGEAEVKAANDDSGAADLYVEHEKEAKLASEVKEAQQTAVFDTNAREDARLKKLVEERDEAKETSAAAKDDEEAALARRKAPGGDLYDIAKAQERSKLDQETAGAAQKVAYGQRQAPGGDLSELADEKAGHTEEASGGEARAKARIAIAKTKNGSVSDMDAGVRTQLQKAAYEQAVGKRNTAIADTTESLERSKDILEAPDGAIAREMAGVDIGLSKNTNIEVATAAKAERADTESDITAVEELYERDALGSEDTLAILGVDSHNPDNDKFPATRKGSTAPIGVKEEEAAIRRIASGPDKKANTALAHRIGIYAERAKEAEEIAGRPGATDKQKDAAAEARYVAKRLQGALVKAYRANPGSIPPFYSTTDIDALGRGEFTTSFPAQVIYTIASGKVTPGAAAKWSIDHYKPTAEILSKPPEEIKRYINEMAALVRKTPAEVAQSLADYRPIIDTAEDDPAYKGTHETRNNPQIAKVRANLKALEKAGAIPPAKNVDGSAYFRAEYEGPGRKKEDKDGRPVPKYKRTDDGSVRRDPVTGLSMLDED
jgi:hypothetical protein